MTDSHHAQQLLTKPYGALAQISQITGKPHTPGGDHFSCVLRSYGTSMCRTSITRTASHRPPGVTIFYSSQQFVGVGLGAPARRSASCPPGGDHFSSSQGVFARILWREGAPRRGQRMSNCLRGKTSYVPQWVVVPRHESLLGSHHRRVFTLYFARGAFRCRHCHGLAYECQAEDRERRAQWRANKATGEA